MRHVILALLLLSACTAYPKLDWPAGSGAVPAPKLLPQAALVAGPTATDPGPALAGRAGALRNWATAQGQAQSN